MHLHELQSSKSVALTQFSPKINENHKRVKVKLFSLFVRVFSQFKVKVAATTMVRIVVVITLLFLAHRALIIQFTRKFQKRHSIVKLNNSPAIMLMLKLNAKSSIFAH